MSVRSRSVSSTNRRECAAASGRRFGGRSRISSLHARMPQEIVRLFPGCPPDRAEQIACRTAARGSGRVGRSAAGRALDPEAIERAVAASVHHQDTRYDDLLMSGFDRNTARAEVRDHVSHTLDAWRSASEKDVAASPRPQLTRRDPPASAGIGAISA